MPLVVWITGAGGFSGRHLSRYLRALPGRIELIGLGRTPAAKGDLDSFHVADILDESAIRKLAKLRPPDRVFHLAGLMPPAPEEDLWRINVAGTVALLRALGIKPGKGLRVLSVGSAAEYLPATGNLTEEHPSGGLTPYGRTKWAQTVVALACGRELKLHVSVARTFNLVGPGLSQNLVAGSLCAQFSNNPERSIEVGDLRASRDFVDVRDAVAAYWRILQKGRLGALYNVSSGRATSIRTVVRSFAALSEFNGTLRESTSRLRRGEMHRVCGDNSELKRLGWRPSIPLRKSVADMLEWSRSQ